MMSFPMDDILNSPSKLALLRVLVSRKGFKGTGRELAKLAGYSAPSTHESLKDLHAREVLSLDIIGKQHIYSLNEGNRIVMKIICPMFQAEGGFKEEIRDFLLDEMKKARVKGAIASLILYGSAQKGTAGKKSDVDIAVIVSRAADVKRVADIFVADTAARFKAYFGVQLDPYVKSSAEFRARLKKNQPPVSTLMRSYSVLYGKEPLEI